MADGLHLRHSLPVDTLARAWAPQLDMAADRLGAWLLGACLDGSLDRVPVPEEGGYISGVLYRDRYGHLREKDARLLFQLFGLIASTRQPARFAPAVRPAVGVLRRFAWARKRPDIARLAAQHCHSLQITRPGALAVARARNWPVPDFWQEPPPRAGGPAVTAEKVEAFLTRFCDGRTSESLARRAAERHFGVPDIPEKTVWEPAIKAMAFERKPPERRKKRPKPRRLRGLRLPRRERLVE